MPFPANLTIDRNPPRRADSEGSLSGTVAAVDGLAELGLFLSRGGLESGRLKGSPARFRGGQVPGESHGRLRLGTTLEKPDGDPGLCPDEFAKRHLFQVCNLADQHVPNKSGVDAPELDRRRDFVDGTSEDACVFGDAIPASRLP